MSRASSACPRTTTPGRSRRCCSSTSRGRGRCPIRGSGRCAARPGTSPTPRSCRWVAADRAVKAVERFGLEGPVGRWRKLRAQIHDDVCAKGFDPERNAFVQYYGGKALDAALLLIPLVGFLPPDDPRVIGTVDAIQRELTHDGLVRRYAAEQGVDGMTGGEATFITCSYWLVDNLAMLGRRDEARELFEHLLALRNDVGLLAEEYDPVERRQLGNFPQAFSHVGLINSAHNLTTTRGPAQERAEDPPESDA